jgi:lipid-A-disaccharide synthase
VEIAIIAGEASGDLHGSLLAREIRARAPGASLWGFGGEGMRAAGVAIDTAIDALAVLGFAEVVARLPFFARLGARLRRQLAERRPDAVVLVDYPGFNLRVAAAARGLGLRVAYYVSPQVWAWGAGRVRRVRESVDRMIVILPFEAPFYAERGVVADFVGHPLLDVAKPALGRDAVRARLGAPEGVPLVGLFPGSRIQEVECHLPLFAGALRRLESEGTRVFAALGRARTVPATIVERALGGGGSMPQTSDVYDLMGAADLLLVASGTATLEAACVGTPMVVVYRTSAVSYALGRLLVRVPHVALANLVAGRRAVPELIQGAATPARVAREAAAILGNPERGLQMRDAFREVRRRLGEPGAAGRAADIVLALARGEARA